MASKRGERKKGRARGELLVFHNPDKMDGEHWDSRRSLANFPRPWRAVAAGPPSSGKSSLIANLVAYARPPYARVIVVSVDPEAHEWQTLCPGCEVLEEIPDFRDIERNEGEHNLVILEDLALNHLDKTQAERLDRLYGHGSSHRNTSVISTAQDIFRLPVCARRQSNIFHLWKAPDVRSLHEVAERVGLRKGELMDLFSLCTEKHDSITLDLTDGTPAPLRKNLFHKVAAEEGE